MRQSTYQHRLKEEKTTPKEVVLKKYPLAVCRKAEDQRFATKNHWRVWSHDKAGAKPLGSSGTTATAWGTAAKDIWREEQRAKHETAVSKSMFEMGCALLTFTGWHSSQLLDFLKTFERLNTMGVTVDEFIEHLERR